MTSIQRNIIIVSLVFGAVIFLAVFVLLFPLFKSIRADHKKLVQSKEQLVLLKARGDQIKQFETNSPDFQDELNQLHNLFIDFDPPVSFIAFLETSAQASQVPLKIQPGIRKKVQGEPWPSIDFFLSEKTPYTNLLKFIAKLENAPYLIALSDIRMQQTIRADEVEFSLYLKVYTK